MQKPPWSTWMTSFQRWSRSMTLARSSTTSTIMKHLLSVLHSEVLNCSNVVEGTKSLLSEAKSRLNKPMAMAMELQTLMRIVDFPHWLYQRQVMKSSFLKVSIYRRATQVSSNTTIWAKQTQRRQMWWKSPYHRILWTVEIFLRTLID